MVRTAGAIRISGGKSSKKSSGAAAPSSSSISSKSSGSSHASGNRLPPIPHTDVPSWQKPITNFFNSGGSKSRDKQSDSDEKMEQDTGTSNIQPTSHERSEPAQSSSSSCNGGIETDNPGKRSQVKNESEKNNEPDSSVDKDVSDAKAVTDSLEDVPHKSPATEATPKNENREGNEPVKENQEVIDTAEKPKVNESVSEQSVEDDGSEVKQNEVLAAVSNKSIEISSHNKKISCVESNESLSKPVEEYDPSEKQNKILIDNSSKNIEITKVLGETDDINNKDNRCISPVGGNFDKKSSNEKENCCQKEVESGDGEKEHAEENYDGEPDAKKMKT